MKLEITSEQWNRYIAKYGNLIYKISHMITGDPAIANFEDNQAELYIAALDSIQGFHRKTGMDFDQMMKEKNFDGYTKTCLWKNKARRGMNLTKKMPFRNKFVSTHENEDEVFDIADTSGIPAADRLVNEEFLNQFDTNTSKVVTAILEDPTIMDESGRVRPYSLMRITGMTIKNITKILRELGVDPLKESNAS